jgi:hypothetical protein
MISFNRKIQYSLNTIFREYITKFTNQCIQSANKRKLALLTTNDALIRTEISDDDIPSYPSSNFIGGLIFLSISTGIYLFISRKK